MESTRIEQLMDAWLEGNTTLEQEAILREYFTAGEVAPHLQMYVPMFEGFVRAKEEVSHREVSLPKSKFSIQPYWYSVAAIIVVAITVGSIVFSGTGLTQEEEEALAAYNKAKETMYLLSASLNKGTENVKVLDEFSKGTASINYINQFTETKNRILK